MRRRKTVYNRRTLNLQETEVWFSLNGTAATLGPFTSLNLIDYLVCAFPRNDAVSENRCTCWLTPSNVLEKVFCLVHEDHDVVDETKCVLSNATHLGQHRVQHYNFYQCCGVGDSVCINVSMHKFGSVKVSTSSGHSMR